MEKHKNVSVKEFAKDIQNQLLSSGLDIELNVLNYKEYKFNFLTGVFERTQKSLLPIINGIGNVNFDQRDTFREFNLFLCSNYEKSKQPQNLNFKMRYTPINRHFIAGDKIHQIDNLIEFNSKIKTTLKFDFKHSLVIFTTPLHFNYNPDVIKKLHELDDNVNLNIYLVFTTDKTQNEDYDRLCTDFINHYKFQKLKYLLIPNYNEYNQDNDVQYKHFNLKFDLTDPSKICFFINSEGLIISDFVEFSDEEFKNIKLTITTNNEDNFLSQIKNSKRYDYKYFDSNTKEPKISNIEAKGFNTLIKHFNNEIKFKSCKNNFLTIQFRQYFDINADKGYHNETVEKVSILYALNKKYYKIYEDFMCMVQPEIISKENIFYNGVIIDNKEKLINTLKIIKDEIDEHKIEENIITYEKIKIEFNMILENGKKKKMYDLINLCPVNIEEANKEETFYQLLKLSELENELTKDKKNPANIFNQLFLIPRLNIGDHFVPLDKKYLSVISGINYSQQLLIKDEVTVYYFFAAWSGPSLSKLAELNKISKENKIKVISICIDSNLEELIENLTYGLFPNISDISFEIYYSNTQANKEFEIFQKLYSAFKVNNSITIIDNQGFVRLNDNITNVTNLKERIENIIQKPIENKITENIIKNNIPIEIVKRITSFYKQNFKNIFYSHEFYLKVKTTFILNKLFKIIDEKVDSITIKSQLRSEDNYLIKNFIESLNVELEFTNSIIETIDLNNLYTEISAEKVNVCSICKENFVKVYYCQVCENFTCKTCQPQHEHNLILARRKNINNDYFTNIDKARLGDNLAYYGTLKSRSHQAGCNRCENIINDQARFICLNCLPGKVSAQTGYADYCEACVNKFISKWETEVKQNEIETNHMIHDEFNHIYLRLDYSVTYFDY